MHINYFTQQIIYFLFLWKKWKYFSSKFIIGLIKSLLLFCFCFCSNQSLTTNDHKHLFSTLVSLIKLNCYFSNLLNAAKFYHYKISRNVMKIKIKQTKSKREKKTWLHNLIQIKTPKHKTF